MTTTLAQERGAFPVQRHSVATSMIWNVMVTSVTGGEEVLWTRERASRATSLLLRDCLGLSVQTVKFYSDGRYNRPRAQIGVGLRVEYYEPITQNTISAAMEKAQMLLNRTLRTISLRDGVNTTFEITPGSGTEKEAGLVEVIE